MACRQRNDLFDLAVQEDVIADKQRPRSRLDQALEGSIDFTDGAGFQRLDLEPNDTGRHQHVSLDQLINWVSRVHEKGDRGALGTSSCNSASPFAPNSLL